MWIKIKYSVAYCHCHTTACLMVKPPLAYRAMPCFLKALYSRSVTPFMYGRTAYCFLFPSSIRSLPLCFSSIVLYCTIVFYSGVARDYTQSCLYIRWFLSRMIFWDASPWGVVVETLLWCGAGPPGVGVETLLSRGAGPLGVGVETLLSCGAGPLGIGVETLLSSGAGPLDVGVETPFTWSWATGCRCWNNPFLWSWATIISRSKPWGFTLNIHSLLSFSTKNTNIN